MRRSTQACTFMDNGSPAFNLPPPILFLHPQVYFIWLVTLDLKLFKSQLIMHEPVEILASSSNKNTPGLYIMK